MLFPIESLEPRRLCAVDLYVSSVEFPIGTLGPNDTAPVSISIRNSGTTGVITPFSGRIYLSKDATLDGADITVGTFSIGSLPSKTTAAIVADIAMKNRVPKGTYHGLVMVDTGLQVKEFDETNNVTAGFMASMNVLAAPAGTVTIPGTDDDDHFRISQSGSIMTVQHNGTTVNYHSGDVAQFHIEMAGGNDQLYVQASVVTPTWIHGGAGHDTIAGGSGHDTLMGAVGNDRIDGGLGNDWVYGNAGNDRLVGAGGADRIWGGDGNDFLDGGAANDWLYAGGGLDNVLAGNGNDFLHLIDGEVDTADGGAGWDTAEEDEQDVLTSVEV
ncbi:MAG TPA: CARDB domain-containing protein [Tepidisphaeraceae bacterium]|nr:CARDB domain-containing protein [Tepidisphaeraceae bacterium]